MAVIAQIRVATELDIDNLANLIATFRDHLALKLPNQSEILSSLKRLLVEKNVDFLIAYTDNDDAVAYTQLDITILCGLQELKHKLRIYLYCLIKEDAVLVQD